MVKRADALKLSAWLAHEHPDLFRQVAAHAKRTRSNLGSLGDVTDVGITTAFDAPAPDLSAVTFDSSSISAPSIDVGSVDSGGGGFWSSIGSSLESAGSAVTSAVGSVAGYLTSSQGMNTLAALTGTYFKAQAQGQQAQAQQAIAQTQIARVQSGVSPAPIRYTTNPVTGAVTPVYYAAGGVPQVLTPQMLSQLHPSAVTQYLPYILIGGGVLLAVALLASRK